MKFSFVGPSYTGLSNVTSDEECINLYPGSIESKGAQTDLVYTGTPGLAVNDTFADGPVRGQIFTGTRRFAVSADTLYEVAADGTQTVWGTVANDGLPVSMAFSAIQLFIVSGGLGYCFTLAPGTWAANTAYPVGTLIEDGAGHIQSATAAQWAASTAYAVGAQIVDPNGNIQQAAQSRWIAGTSYAIGAEIVDPGGHVQKASAAQWAASTVYIVGAQVVDTNGNIQQAAAAQWSANTNYGIGDQIVDSNGNVQQVTTAGTSGSATPAWAMAGTTADGTVVWTFQAASGGNAGTSGTTTPVWGSVITFDGKGPLFWIYQGASGGQAGTSGSIIPTFNDTGGNVTDSGTLIWSDQGLATNAGTSGTDQPAFLLTGTTVDAGTLVWVFQASSNGNAGTSGPVIPTFNDTGGTTPDANTLIWQDQGLRLLDVSSQLAGAPVKVKYGDTYFTVIFAGSNKFQVSEILDGTSWPGIQVSEVSVFAENIVSIEISHRELWVFGSQHIQPYQNTGSDEVYDVIPGTLIETGCAACFATDVVDNTPFWVGEDIRGGRQVWRASGYTPQRISTHAVETALTSYSATQIANMVTYSYQDVGHLFWVLYIPGTDCTWVYDVAENLWHKRAEWLPSTGTFGPHRSWNHVWAFGKHLVGDWQTGTVWEMRLAYDTGGGVYAFVTENGNTIRRLRRSPTIINEMEWIYIAEITIDFATGLGPQPPFTDGDGNPRPPQAMLRWSDDRGSTWGNQHTLYCGFSGQYMARAICRRTGRTRYRVFELTMTDPIPWTIVNAYLRTA